MPIWRDKKHFLQNRRKVLLSPFGCVIWGGKPLDTSSPEMWDKEPAHQCRRYKKRRFDPWVGRSPGTGHGNPLQYSCLENSMDTGAWQATVHRDSQTQTRLK